MSNDKKEKERIFIQVSLSKKQKALIKKIAKRENTNASNLMRIAVFEYIRKLENPETFSQTTINPVLLEQIEKNTKKILEKQEIQAERQNILEEMRNTLTLIKDLTLKPDPEVKGIILNLFKAYNSLNPKEIIEKTNLDKEIVFSVISELQTENMIEMTSKGRFKLK